MRRETLLYGGAIVLFGGVVLWAAEAPWQVTTIALVLAGLMLVAAAALLRPAPTLLIVGEPAEGGLGPAGPALEGYRILRCPGPTRGLCPVLVGRPCPAGGAPDAAVVLRRPDEHGPLAPCGEALGIPQLVVEEGSDRELEVRGRYARVGSRRGPAEVERALDAVLTLAA